MKVIKRINAKGKTAYSSDILPNIVLCAMDGIEGVVNNRLSDAKKEAARVKRMISIERFGRFHLRRRVRKGQIQRQRDGRRLQDSGIYKKRLQHYGI